ncbi:hypothetical protein Dvina_20520 [Dactylosporangium vinaceum]|uniref:Uncharacterized protein n=1 Tax=Dactylosporangium vinaceum TaxID=53362 RepID=A0ABV5MS61_9ACTN|nr:hypothetical protein [Dactylosporangium vinaceum]UAC00232.1 hypothetical protein Dvina_20520 [Dactylosporangium vinaceum]
MPAAQLIRPIALGVTLLLGGWLILADPAQPSPAAPPQPSLHQIWPAVQVATQTATLDDGTRFTPALYLDPYTAVGVAPSPDGRAQRVLLRTGYETQQLASIDADHYPRFTGFTADAGTFFWVEATATTQQPLSYRLWRADTRGNPTVLTTDTGEGVFQGAEHDLVLHDRLLSWAATAGSRTEIRSIPTSGGPVTTTAVDGSFELSAWPWLQTAAAARQSGRQELLDPATGRRTTVVKSAAETVDCSPTWCRSIVAAGTGGDTSYSVLHPDGTARHRVGGADTFAAVGNVALLDRFEVVLQTGTRSAFDSSHRLSLFDLTTFRLITVADDVDQVQAAGHFLWWSTGDRQRSTWHALDLAALTR